MSTELSKVSRRWVEATARGRVVGGTQEVLRDFASRARSLQDLPPCVRNTNKHRSIIWIMNISDNYLYIFLLFGGTQRDFFTLYKVCKGVDYGFCQQDLLLKGLSCLVLYTNLNLIFTLHWNIIRIMDKIVMSSFYLAPRRSSVNHANILANISQCLCCLFSFKCARYYNSEL